MLEVTPLRLGVVIDAASASPRRTPEVSARVDSHWDAHLSSRPESFDGLLYSLRSRSAGRLRVEPVRYRDWVAQSREPALFGDAPVRPVAVSGLLRLRDGVLFGRRSSSVQQAPGLWELPPSGSLEAGPTHPASRPSAEGQLATEFKEELNLPWRHVASVRPLALLEDPESRVVDVGFVVDVDLGIDEVVARHADGGSSEYAELRAVGEEGLESFLRGHACVEVSRSLLELAGFVVGGRAGSSLSADPRP